MTATEKLGQAGWKISGRNIVIGEQRPEGVIIGVEAKFQKGLQDGVSWSGGTDGQVQGVPMRNRGAQWLGRSLWVPRPR